MPGPIAKDMVVKSFKIDRQLAGAIGAFGDAAGYNFSEAVRELCKMGLSVWPGNAFSMAPAVGAEARILTGQKEIKDEIIGRVRYMFEEELDEVHLDIDELKRAIEEIQTFYDEDGEEESASWDYYA